MENNIEQYFREEKVGALVLIVVGVMAILIGAYLLFKVSNSTLRCISYPLLTLALAEAVIGGVIYFRTDAQVADLLARYKGEPAAFHTTESERMNKVMRSFRIAKTVEVVFILTSIALILISGRPLWVGVGIGLLVQSAFLLGFDKIAEQRGAVYVKAIREAQSP